MPQASFEYNAEYRSAKTTQAERNQKKTERTYINRKDGLRARKAPKPKDNRSIQ